MPRSPKKRIDALLVEQGYFGDLKTAQGFILAGKIVVGDAVCSKPGTMIREDAKISVRGAVLKYASRGGYKLEAALAKFPVSVAGKIVLDAGASTGGFTDCLLQHGAAKVYAVDAGFGQLRGKLAADPRVVNLERTNVGDLVQSTFAEPLDFAVFDLSYLSAAKAAPAIAKLFPSEAQIIGLIKPLYEGVAEDQMRDPAALEAALVRTFEAFTRDRLIVRGLIVSPILGNNGTVEFLAWITSGDETSDRSLIAQAIEQLAKEPPSAGAV